MSDRERTIQLKIDTKTILKIGIAAFLLYICIYYWETVANLLVSLFEASVPLIVGCVIAYVLNLLMSAYEKIYFPKTQKKWIIKSRRPICLIFSFITLAAVITLLIVLIIPQLTSCVQLLISKLPAALTSAVDTLEKWDILPEDIIASLNAIDWQGIIGKTFDTLTSGLGNIVGVLVNVVSSLVGGVLTAFIGIIFAVYLLISKDRLGSQIKTVAKRFIKESVYEKLSYALGIINDSFRKYIVGQCTEAVILGVLCALGMWIFRLPYAAMIGTFIAFTALVPVAGAYIGGAIGAFMIFTVSPIKALVFIIFLVVLQQLEGNLIYPKVVGTSIGLPAIWVLVAVTIGGGIMGIAGMLLGVPLAAAAYKMLSDRVKTPKPTKE